MSGVGQVADAVRVARAEAATVAADAQSAMGMVQTHRDIAFHSYGSGNRKSYGRNGEHACNKSHHIQMRKRLRLLPHYGSS